MTLFALFNCLSILPGNTFEICPAIRGLLEGRRVRTISSPCCPAVSLKWNKSFYRPRCFETRKSRLHTVWRWWVGRPQRRAIPRRLFKQGSSWPHSSIHVYLCLPLSIQTTMVWPLSLTQGKRESLSEEAALPLGRGNHFAFPCTQNTSATNPAWAAGS